MTETDLMLLQGRWIPERFEENGVTNPPDSHSAPGAVLTITNATFHVAIPGQGAILEGVFTVDETAVPKEITWVDAIGDDAGKPLPAIYELSRDRFLFVAADAGAARPAEFRTGPGLTLRSFTRAEFPNEPYPGLG